MEIKLTENYRLTKSSDCWSVERKQIAQRGDNIGNVYWVNIGYHGAIEKALNTALRDATDSVEVKSLEEYLRNAKRVFDEFKADFKIWQEELKSSK